MSPKELLREEIDQLDETATAQVLDFVKHMSKSKDSGSKPSLMSRLRKISIDAPEDFSSNLDLYLSGEKSVG